jgi:hypothetical protein
VTLVICAVAVSGAVFIIMAHAYVSGVMKISSLPLATHNPDDILNASDQGPLPSLHEGCREHHEA